jgi:hypothetical protein
VAGRAGEGGTIKLEQLGKAAGKNDRSRAVRGRLEKARLVIVKTTRSTRRRRLRVEAELKPKPHKE